jgi:ubiquinone/menaquinone biosynthesis C-methylase UbiE
MSLRTVQRVRADFDRLARLHDDAWDHNLHHHGFLLDRVPRPCREALEIGCGTGALARALAARAEHVLALDLSPEMIRVARAREPRCANIEYQLADVSTWPFPSERFDCVASIATLHHFDARALLARMRDALRPGGMLLVLDLVSDENLLDLARSALAVAANPLLRLAHSGRLRDPKHVREAWAEHGRGEVYLPLSEVREICRELLPGAQVRRHLLWRYSIVWRKPT